MSAKLLFNGQAHQLTLIGSNGEPQGAWLAYNNVDRHATLTHLRNQTYTVQDKTAPRRHVGSADGPYGLYGIIRTTDEAMRALMLAMRVVPILTIDVINNSAPLARATSGRGQRGQYHV